MSVRTATDEVRYAQAAERAELRTPPYEGADLDYGERPPWYTLGQSPPCGIRSFHGPEWIAPPRPAYRKSMTTPTPVATFTNPETGMESYVFASTDAPGTFNVTLKDLDSGEFVPCGYARIPDLDKARATAMKVAGLSPEPAATVNVAL